MRRDIWDLIFGKGNRRDTDLDGAPNVLDCRPFNPYYQDLSKKAKKMMANRILDKLAKRHHVRKPKLKLKDEKLETVGSYAETAAATFQPGTNTIALKLDELIKEEDVRYVLRHEFSHYLDWVKDQTRFGYEEGKKGEIKAEEFASRERYNVGDKVKFKHKGKTYRGNIEKKKPYDVVIEVDNPPKGYRTATLPYRRIKKIGR